MKQQFSVNLASEQVFKMSLGFILNQELRGLF